MAVDQEYHKTMLELHQKVNASEVIVGWYVSLFLLLFAALVGKARGITNTPVCAA